MSLEGIVYLVSLLQPFCKMEQGDTPANLLFARSATAEQMIMYHDEKSWSHLLGMLRKLTLVGAFTTAPCR